jgi:hypothetical protein
MAKSPSASYRAPAQDGVISRQDSLTVRHIADRIADVPLQKGLTTAHLAQGLAQNQSGNSSSQTQGTGSKPSAAANAPAETSTGRKD